MSRTPAQWGPMVKSAGSSRAVFPGGQRSAAQWSGRAAQCARLQRTGSPDSIGVKLIRKITTPGK